MKEDGSTAKLLDLTSRWLKDIEHPHRPPRIIAPEDEIETVDVALQSRSGHSRNSSKLSIRLLDADRSISRPPSPISDRPASEQQIAGPKLTKGPYEFIQLERDRLPSYSRPSRTGTGLLKRGLLRWPSNKDETILCPPPRYTPCEPKFDDVRKATELLSACYQPSPECTSRWQKTSEYILAPYICLYHIISVIPALLTHPLHSSLLLALLSHGSNLGYSRKVSYPQAIPRALHHPCYTTLKARIPFSHQESSSPLPPPNLGKCTMISSVG